MENLILKAQPRTILGKQVKKLRQQGKIPAVLYGRDIKSQALELNDQDFRHIFQKAGASTLIDLQIDDQKPVKVLVHEPQKDPVTDKILHADIYQVKMTEKIHTEIPLNFIGEAPAITDLEGNLITNRDNLEVECLPDALVPSIDVDISSLKTFNDLIHTKDIKVPEGIEVLTDAEETIVLVTPPRSEEELAEELAVPTAEEEKAAVEELAETPEEESAEGEEKAEETPTEQPTK